MRFHEKIIASFLSIKIFDGVKFKISNKVSNWINKDISSNTTTSDDTAIRYLAVINASDTAGNAIKQTIVYDNTIDTNDLVNLLGNATEYPTKTIFSVNDVWTMRYNKTTSKWNFTMEIDDLDETYIVGSIYKKVAGETTWTKSIADTSGGTTITNSNNEEGYFLTNLYANTYKISINDMYLTPLDSRGSIPLLINRDFMSRANVMINCSRKFMLTNKGKDISD